MPERVDLFDKKGNKGYNVNGKRMNIDLNIIKGNGLLKESINHFIGSKNLSYIQFEIFSEKAKPKIIYYDKDTFINNIICLNNP